MSRKMIYTLTLFVFIVMWGVFGLAAAPPARAEPALQDTLAPTVVVPTVVVTTVVNQTVIAPAIGVTQVVPVTGSAGPNIMMLLFYGFLGLLAIVLLVALCASANRTTYVRRDGPPPQPDDLP
ncbi:MAG TPA: hypothetical protein VK909_21480 [Anaerolineales bacterium]|nr:hypothetical protein [Anaerolineales bacterium]